MIRHTMRQRFCESAGNPGTKAMNELGMVYAANGNVVEYDSPTSDYVKQYNEIPSDGILAKSKDVSK